MLTMERYLEEAKHLFVTGHPGESIDLFTRAKEEGCNPVNVLLGRGAAYLNIEEIDKAVEDFTEVIGTDEDNERAYYYRGIALLKKGEYENAARDLTQSVRLNTERGTAFLARGLALSELGREEEAVRDFKIAATLSDREVEGFISELGSYRSRFERSMALIEGERGPLGIVLNDSEVRKLRHWME